MKPPLPRPVAAALDAANAGDTDAFVASFHPDGVVDDWGREFRGPDKIREWSDAEFIGMEVSLEVESVELESDIFVVAATVGGNGFNGPSDFAFEVAGDRLARMSITG